jgi:hypothetical protein
MQNDHPRHPNANGGTTLRSRIADGRSTLCFELAGPLGCDDVGEFKKAWRTTTCVAGNRALVIDLGLLMAIDGAGRRLLSCDHDGEIRFVASCERTGTLAESIAGIPIAPDPAICEPCGIWVSLDARHER